MLHGSVTDCGVRSGPAREAGGGVRYGESGVGREREREERECEGQREWRGENVWRRENGEINRERRRENEGKKRVKEEWRR